MVANFNSTIEPGTHLLDYYMEPGLMGVIESIDIGYDLVTTFWFGRGRLYFELTSTLLYIQDGIWIPLDMWTMEIEVPDRNRRKRSFL